MDTGPAAGRNWFAHGGADYARFRPHYPPELLAWLAALPAAHRLAVDVGCGSGQLTAALAGSFDLVVGLDPSPGQLAQARAGAGLRYACAKAEQLPLPAASADLVVAAQAAHWFDLPRFYAEVRRVAAKGARLALVSYGVLRLPPDLQPCFSHFYDHVIRPYWPPQRRLVDDGYRSLPFPFRELPAPAMRIVHPWRARDFTGYVTTWSAVCRLREAGQTRLLARFVEDISALWGDGQALRTVTWPLQLRVGVVS